MSTIVKKYQMNYFDPTSNSNKVWIGIAYEDGTFETKWGRIGEGRQLAGKVKSYGSSIWAVNQLEIKRREKLIKGYQDTEVLEQTEVISTVSIKKTTLAVIAKKQIVTDENDKTTHDLISYLAEVNIHNITQNTSIRYNSQTATFSTPLGVLKPDAIHNARTLLAEIKDLNAGDLRGFSRHQKITDYFRLVPKDFGMKVPSIESLLNSGSQIDEQSQILDALESAILTTDSDSEVEKIFECRLSKVPHWTDEGKALFHKIRKLYESTKNQSHKKVSGLKLTRVYEVEIPEMKKRFEALSSRIGNVRDDLWHGTKASNLLSILKQGLIIPPSSSAHCTGRMFGNGIYTSLQSSKALNYATNFWNNSGPNNQKTFMFLCEAALGKTYQPTSFGHNFPRPCSDSTWVEAGTAGVINHECIVYNTGQINLKYLCEFGE